MEYARFTRRLAVRRLFSWAAGAGIRLAGGPGENRHGAVVSDAFIPGRFFWGMAHASTIAESGDGLVAAWFSGLLESRPTVVIQVSRHNGRGWSLPVEVASGRCDDGKRCACWNPVLFQPADGPLMLFYKVGRTPRDWWGMCTTSDDSGRTWRKPRRLAQGMPGPVKNKPVELAGGALLSPSSTEGDGWRVHLEHSTDRGETWVKVGPLDDGDTQGAIQPSILSHSDGSLQLLCRTRQGRVAESWSGDGGFTWTEMRLTGLPNPDSGTDAVSLADGRQLLVYNRSTRRRSPLMLALSRDGRIWQDALTLARGFGEYSYPSVIQSADGLVHITYSWNLSRIKHVVVDPAALRV